MPSPLIWQNQNLCVRVRNTRPHRGLDPISKHTSYPSAITIIFTNLLSSRIKRKQSAACAVNDNVDSCIRPNQPGFLKITCEGTVHNRNTWENNVVPCSWGFAPAPTLSVQQKSVQKIVSQRFHWTCNWKQNTKKKEAMSLSYMCTLFIRGLHFYYDVAIR